MILKYSDKPWDWNQISTNPNITWDIIRRYPDKPWDWYKLSVNPSIKLSAINYLRLKIIKSNIIKRYWKKYTWDPEYPFAQKMVLKRAELS